MLAILKYTFYILSLFTLTSCGSSMENAASETIATADTSSLDDKDRRMVKLIQYSSNSQKPVVTYEYIYNENGNVIRENIVDSSSNVPRMSVKYHSYRDTLLQQTVMITHEADTSYIIDYFYNDKNLLVKQESRDTGVYQRITYDYDDRGNPVVQTTYNRDQGTAKMEFSYTETDKMLEGKSYDYSGNLVKWNKYAYNKDDKASDLFFFSPAGDTLYHFVYEYDAMGNKIAEKEYAKNGNIYIVKTWSYNKENWLILEEGNKYNIYKGLYIRDNRGKLERIKYTNQFGNIEREMVYE